MKYEKTIKIPKDELQEWEELLKKDWMDYETEDFPEESTVFCVTAKFDDGLEMDVKVNTNTRDDGTIWTEAVLFTESGGQIGCTDVSYGLGGEWTVWCGDDEYVVNVVGI